jgi:hypothetical protein
MNLVDSCGWLEYFADGPNADFYGAALEDTGSLLLPTICLLEVFNVFCLIPHDSSERVCLRSGRSYLRQSG